MAYDTRRIIRELADDDRRRSILSAFWRNADAPTKALATAQLARALHFREETLRKLPLAKKSDLLASRLGAHEFEQFFEMALMQYHTGDRKEMLAAFLERWNIPHNGGSIEVDEYTVPSSDEIRKAVAELRSEYEPRDVAIYLASAGLLMGDEWRDAAWPVADDIVADLA